MQISETLASSAIQETALNLGINQPKKIFWGRIGARVVTFTLGVGGAIGLGIGIYATLTDQVALAVLGITSFAIAGTGSFCLWKNTPEKELENNIRDLKSENSKMKALIKTLQQSNADYRNANDDYKRDIEDAKEELRELNEEQVDATNSLGKIASKLMVVRNAFVRLKNLNVQYEKNIQDLLQTIKMMFDILPQVKDQTEKFAVFDSKLLEVAEILKEDSREFKDENMSLDEIVNRAKPLNAGIEELQTSIKSILPVLQNSVKERDEFAQKIEVLAKDNAQMKEVVKAFQNENKKVESTNTDLLDLLKKLDEIELLKTKK